MLETLGELVPRAGSAARGMTAEEAQERAIKGISKGLLKTISKMGISTIPSYCGAQIFEAVGLEPELIDRHFTGTPSRIAGIGVDGARPRGARPPRRAPTRTRTGTCCRSAASTPGAPRASTTSGTPRRSRCSSTRCATAATTPTSSTRGSSTTRPRARRRCAGCCSSARRRRADPARARSSRQPRSSSASRPARCRSARSAREAHETLAIAMNRIGGKSNTGEGGEDPVALHPRRERRLAPLGDQAGRLGPLRRQHQLPRQRRPAPDQDGAGRQARRRRAAARAQGRPVHREDPLHDARASGLISPPPHHDIYSIEDLKQLIYDLRCANPRGPGLGEARRRDGRRHGRRRRREVQRRPRAHLRATTAARAPRRSPRSTRRRALGDRARRDAADARPATTCAPGSGCRPTGS